MNQFDKVIEGDSIHWLCVFPNNVSDVDHPVECFPMFRGYPWPYRQILDEAQNALLTSTYYGRGQIRSQLGDSQQDTRKQIEFNFPPTKYSWVRLIAGFDCWRTLCVGMIIR